MHDNRHTSNDTSEYRKHLIGAYESSHQNCACSSTTSLVLHLDISILGMTVDLSQITIPII